MDKDRLPRGHLPTARVTCPLKFGSETVEILAVSYWQCRSEAQYGRGESALCVARPGWKSHARCPGHKSRARIWREPREILAKGPWRLANRCRLRPGSGVTRIPSEVSSSSGITAAQPGNFIGMSSLGWTSNVSPFVWIR
jgi:hypothetical protein